MNNVYHNVMKCYPSLIRLETVCYNVLDKVQQRKSMKMVINIKYVRNVNQINHFLTM